MPRTPDDEQLQMTSLIDMSFLLLVFFMCLPFKCLDHKLQAFLPRGEGIGPWSAAQKDTVKIRIRRQGDDLVYALGQHATPSAEGLEPVIRALGPDYRYEIDAGPTVPWQRVVDAVNLLAAAGCKDVRFRGGPPLTPEVRRR
jgi:biopolymer transport protein ExbD